MTLEQMQYEQLQALVPKRPAIKCIRERLRQLPEDDQNHMLVEIIGEAPGKKLRTMLANAIGLLCDEMCSAALEIKSSRLESGLIVEQIELIDGMLDRLRLALALEPDVKNMPVGNGPRR